MNATANRIQVIAMRPLTLVGRITTRVFEARFLFKRGSKGKGGTVDFFLRPPSTPITNLGIEGVVEGAGSSASRRERTAHAFRPACTVFAALARRMASAGSRITDAVTDPLCTAARASRNDGRGGG